MLNPVTILSLDLIRRDGGTQPRDHISAEITKEYADTVADGVTLPPVTTFYDGTDYWLADGFHRVAAHELLGLAEIAADVRQGARRDAILYSVGANAAHGYRRSNADKRRAVLTLLSDPEWAGWSDREIARRCVVDHKTVSALRPDVTGEIPSERTYTTKHGTTATMNTSAIGKTKADDTADDNMEALGTAPRRWQIAVPEGADILELCRKGIALEASGEVADNVADQLGLSRKAYRLARQMVLLSEHEGLSTADAALVAEALDILVSTLECTRAWEIAEPIAIKLWGDAPRWDRIITLADRRLEKFEWTFGIVIQSCLTTDEIELPYLSDHQIKQFTKEIGQARRALSAFASRIEELHE